MPAQENQSLANAGSNHSPQPFAVVETLCLLIACHAIGGLPDCLFAALPLPKRPAVERRARSLSGQHRVLWTQRSYDHKDLEWTLESFKGQRADFYEPFKKYLMDEHTCNASPHKHMGTEANYAVKQLRMRGVKKVIMAGPAGNICLESHMRDLVEAGFEIAMVIDTAGAASNEMGDGYTGMMVTWKFIANSLWTTEQAVARLKEAAAA